MTSRTQPHHESTLSELVSALAHANCALWHAEDKARSDVDLVVANAKREIDAWNQTRNDLIEKIDDSVIELCQQKSPKRLSSAIPVTRKTQHG